MKDQVLILLSTYNGEKYIVEQINSILNQKDSTVIIYIRDDGSKDKTVDKIVENFTEGNCIVFKEGNVGCEESFSKLICKGSGHRYYAFADQDDVWKENKLLEAKKYLDKCDGTPALYACNQIVTDSNLNERGLMFDHSSFCRISQKMEENCLLNRHGCTMVWNNELHEIVKQVILENPETIFVHDKLLMMVARLFGRVFQDETALQYYRIHENNVSGLERSVFKRLKKGIKLYWIRENNTDLYAKALLSVATKTNVPTVGYYRKQIETVAKYKDSFSSKISLLNLKQIKPGNILENIFWDISIILGKF